MTVGRPDTLTFKWLTGILVTIVMALTAIWAENLSAQVHEISKQVDTQNTSIANIEGQLPQISMRLKRIEDNQDRIANNLTANKLR